MMTILLGLAAPTLARETPLYSLTERGLKPSADKPFEYRLDASPSTEDLRAAGEWKLSPSGTKTFDPGEEVFWIRYAVKNDSANRDWVIFDQWSFDVRDVRFFIEGPDGTWTESRSGSGLPQEDRDFKNRFTSASFRLDPGKQATIVIRADGEGLKRHSYAIYSMRDFERYSDASQLLLGIYLGLVLLAIIMNGIFAASLRDRAYGWYTAFCLAFGLACFTNAGFWNQWMWAAFGSYTDTVGHYFVRGSVILPTLIAVPFAQHFLGTRERTPRVRRVLWGMLVVNMIAMVIALSDAPEAVDNVAMITSFGGTTALMLFAGMLSLRRGYRPARLFVWGWSVLSASVMLWVATSAGLLDRNLFTVYMPFWGQMIEIVLLSMAVMSRIEFLRDEAAQTENARVETEQGKTLLRVISHDLTNPLTVIQQYALRGLSKSTDPDQKRLWERVIRAAGRQEEILTHVRQMRSLADRKAKLDVGPVELAVAWRGAREAFETRLQEKQLTLDAGLSDVEGLWVVAEEASMTHQVVNNIVSNAIKFSPKGGTISMRAIALEKEVVVEIEDRGIGIPAGMIQVLFDHQAPTSRRGTANEEGTGYGMPLVKAYMDRYGGTIEVESREASATGGSSGTTVRLRFRRAMALSKVA
jgi:signal transduction histidine kinase